MKVVTLREDAGVKSVKDLYTQIRVALEGESEVLLDFSHVKRIDLSVAQVIIAAVKEARARSAVIKMKAVSETVKTQMKICGILR